MERKRLRHAIPCPPLSAFISFIATDIWTRMFIHDIYMHAHTCTYTSYTCRSYCTPVPLVLLAYLAFSMNSGNHTIYYKYGSLMVPSPAPIYVSCNHHEAYFYNFNSKKKKIGVETVIDVDKCQMPSRRLSLLPSSSLVGRRSVSWSHKTIIIFHPRTIFKFYFYA
jgi:hypothetical protein